MKKLYFHVEKHVDIEPEVMHQSCLQLLTEITVAFSESQCDSMSLHDLKLMSIQQVAETSHECATFGSLCMTQDETHSQSCVGLEYGKLIPQLMVVIGCLTGSPRRATPTEDVGALYFEDASMTVVCEVSVYDNGHVTSSICKVNGHDNGHVTSSICKVNGHDNGHVTSSICKVNGHDNGHVTSSICKVNGHDNGHVTSSIRVVSIHDKWSRDQ